MVFAAAVQFLASVTLDVTDPSDGRGGRETRDERREDEGEEAAERGDVVDDVRLDLVDVVVLWWCAPLRFLEMTTIVGLFNTLC